MQKEKQKTELEKKLEAELVAQAVDTTAQDGSPVDATQTSETPAAEPEALAQALAAVTAERDEYKDMLLRARAEFDNYRKRTLREAERLRKTATEALIRDLLPVVDNLERAAAHAGDAPQAFAEGVTMVLMQLKDTLAARGLEAIPAAGEIFDPSVHEALSQMPSKEHPAGVVMDEFQRGYRIGDYVVRPAKVVVSGGPPDSPAEPDTPPTE